MVECYKLEHLKQAHAVLFEPMLALLTCNQQFRVHTVCAILHNVERHIAEPSLLHLTLHVRGFPSHLNLILYPLTDL